MNYKKGSIIGQGFYLNSSQALAFVKQFNVNFNWIHHKEFLNYNIYKKTKCMK